VPATWSVIATSAAASPLDASASTTGPASTAEPASELLPPRTGPAWIRSHLATVTDPSTRARATSAHVVVQSPPSAQRSKAAGSVTNGSDRRMVPVKSKGMTGGLQRIPTGPGGLAMPSPQASGTSGRPSTSSRRRTSSISMVRTSYRKHAKRWPHHLFQSEDRSGRRRRDILAAVIAVGRCVRCRARGIASTAGSTFSRSSSSVSDQVGSDESEMVHLEPLQSIREAAAEDLTSDWQTGGKSKTRNQSSPLIPRC
jgi:hypothetical protein